MGNVLRRNATFTSRSLANLTVVDLLLNALQRSLVLVESLLNSDLVNADGIAVTCHQNLARIRQRDEATTAARAKCRKVSKWKEVHLTSAVFRLECSIDCISGSVGHQQNIFRSFSHCQN